MSDNKTTFTIAGSGIGFKGGNYISHFPLQAAKKAGRQLFLKLAKPEFSKYKSKTSIKFILRERVRGKPGKTYAYEVSRKKLKKPIIIKKDNKEIKIEFEYKVDIIKIDNNEAMRMTGGAVAAITGGGEGDVEGGEYQKYEGGEDEDESEGGGEGRGEEEEGGEGGYGGEGGEGGDDENSDGSGNMEGGAKKKGKKGMKKRCGKKKK
jgi:hypothetical protein